MNSKNTVKNAYKGLLLNFYLDYKKTITLGVIITLSITFFNFIMTIIFLNFNNSNSDENSGVLMIGFFTMLITLFVYTILSVSRDEMHSKFAFPINRRIYAISNFLSMVFGSFFMLVIVTIIAPMEVLIFRFITIFTDKLIYLNTITFKTYIVGFISSWAYMMAIASITYCIFIYIRKYTLYSLPVIAILFTSIISFGWLGGIIKFIFLEQNLLMLIIKLLVISLISHLLGFIPLKRMEVA